MNDDFDGRPSNGLGAFDVPASTTPASDLGRASSSRRGKLRLFGMRPLRLAALLVVLILGVTTVGFVWQSHSAVMLVEDAQAWPVAYSGNPVWVYATITNKSGTDDRLIGASSPAAASAGLYMTPLCVPLPSADAENHCGGLVPLTWWPIQKDETIQMNGQLILSGLENPLKPGQTVEVTFKFANASPVILNIPVVAKPTIHIQK